MSKGVTYRSLTSTGSLTQRLGGNSGGPGYSNDAQFNNPLASPAPGLAPLGPTFGEITSTSVNPRILQFGLKYMF